MKQDKLERFIDDNTTGFNDKEPPQWLWQKIEADLDESQSKKKPIVRNLMIAASSVVLLGVGVWFGTMWSTSQNSVETTELNSIAAVQEYQEAEQYYLKRVGNSWNEIKTFDEHRDVEDDLKQLDEVYEELKQELQNSPEGNKDIIIQALINNYQSKLNILEKVRTKISDIPSNNKASNNDINKI